MTLRMPSTRVVKRRGRPRRTASSAHPMCRGQSTLLNTLWEAGLVPFAFYEAGLVYARLRRQALNLMDAPSIGRVLLKERLDGTRTWEETPTQARLFQGFMATEQHLSSWEKERVQLLRRALEEHKPLEAQTLKKLAQTLYPLLEDLSHFFQNLNACGSLPLRE
ncbi:MAG: hypothetical protein C0514_06720 [Candidatus Puniceispirillum sp.]|nr:hypothetical protein [Candidatus Puniceispirillum sp.]